MMTSLGLVRRAARMKRAVSRSFDDAASEQQQSEVWSSYNSFPPASKVAADECGTWWS